MPAVCAGGWSRPKPEPTQSSGFSSRKAALHFTRHLLLAESCLSHHLAAASSAFRVRRAGIVPRTCLHPARNVHRRFMVGVSLSRSQRTVHASSMRTVRFRKPGWSGERPRALEKPTRGNSSYRITSAAISASVPAQKKLERPGESMFTSGLKRHPIGSGFS